ncbi:MAG: 4-hydroxy-tetrahydrodipicolinate reductase [Holosporales bacterium]|jgi:4-hydroxy-tetrahydrodipicolinate reductase|nr:4-hydroxy-tetrahydrodipicolinate reductase [Holosporales bacterium]
MKLAVLGANGRVGSLVVGLAGEMGCEIRGTVSRGCPISDLFNDSEVVIDFSSPEATHEMLSFELAEGLCVPIVIGTTGLGPTQDELINSLSRCCPIFVSSNMSVGVAILRMLVSTAAKLVDMDFEVEVLDIHHGAKNDAPSGTAIMLGKAIAEARGQCFQEVAKFTRFGTDEPRKKGEIGYAVQRFGNQIGTHEVTFGNAQESLKLRHESYSREGFARGAIMIAKWLITQSPGSYTMADFVGS